MTSTAQGWRSEVELRQATEAARMYYLHQQSKLEIADKLGVNRFKVARLLERAHTSGLVHIEIRDPHEVDVALSEQLAKALGIKRALVLSTATGDKRLQVGALAARYLADTVRSGHSFGLAWSRSTEALVKQLIGLPPCTVVQMCGVVAHATGEAQSADLVRRAAAAVGGQPVMFHAPLVVDEPAITAALRRKDSIAQASAACDRLDVAVIAIGMWVPGESTVHDALSSAEQALFAARGAVAETAGLLINRDGQAIRDGLQQRVIAVSEKQLRRAGDVVALACDEQRVPAIKALAASGLVRTLITYRGLAEMLLAEQP
ncbi:sugar-binding domain-containing protein [Dermatophilaceae bacterium Sec6.4]